MQKVKVNEVAVVVFVIYQCFFLVVKTVIIVIFAISKQNLSALLNNCMDCSGWGGEAFNEMHKNKLILYSQAPSAALNSADPNAGRGAIK